MYNCFPMYTLIEIYRKTSDRTISVTEFGSRPNMILFACADPENCVRDSQRSKLFAKKTNKKKKRKNSPKNIINVKEFGSTSNLTLFGSDQARLVAPVSVNAPVSININTNGRYCMFTLSGDNVDPKNGINR